tara:strand:+ start:20880 stop:23021 length:2142 start_codon:yes stop_codon:yes gene_type:complete
MKKYFFILIALSISLSVKCQDAPKKVTLLWDTSFSMIDRNLTNDLEYLNLYFQKNPTTSLTLVKFSNEIILNQSYTISKGKWPELEKELQNTIYDGATNYKKIKIDETDEVLLFSDGYSYFDKFPTLSAKITVLSSSQNINNDFLKAIAKRSKGDFINLSTEQKNNTIASEFIAVKGTVSDENGALPDVSVVSRGNNTQTVTDSLGIYSISAQYRGVLEFRYVGKNTILSRVSDNGIKNIYMTNGNLVLDELVLKNNKKELIDNGYGTLDKKRLGYDVKTIDGNNIAPVNTDVKNAVVGKFAGVEVSANDDLSQFLGRGKNTTIKGNQYGLIILDGVPLKQSNSSSGFVSNTDFINTENIESITYLKGLAATNIYGSDGSNGVLLIKSKTGSSSFKKKKQKKLGNTPTYIDDIAIKTILNKPYIKEISKASSIDNAYNIYIAQREFYGKEISFFFDVASYFNNWNNPYLVKRILSNVLELNNATDLKLLRVLAYKYEQLGLFEESINIYKKIILIQPNDSQTYRNLALSYQLNKEFLKAQDIYNKIHNNQYTDVNSFSGLIKTINTEYKNLVSLHESTLNIDKIPELFKKKIEYDTRIVFEWSQYDTEFDLQIVNPQKRYFTWSHTQSKESVRFMNEKSQGYGLEEFFITKKDKGEWLFNLTYYGEKTGINSTPTYLRVTVFNNFGKPTQSRKVTTLELYDLNKKETVLKLKI